MKQNLEMLRPNPWIARTSGIGALVLLTLTLGCTNVPEAPAAAEERAAAPGAAAQAQAVESRPIAGGGVTGRVQEDEAARALKDPSNPLSKRSIYYDYDRYDVKDDYKPVVDVHAKYLREHPAARMLIQGNTDDRGGREYNLALGQRRAEGVRRLMILLGAREDQIEAVSLGEEKPRAAGRNERAYAENRRSDILYKGEY